MRTFEASSKRLGAPKGGPSTCGPEMDEPFPSTNSVVLAGRPGSGNSSTCSPGSARTCASASGSSSSPSTCTPSKSVPGQDAAPGPRAVRGKGPRLRRLLQRDLLRAAGAASGEEDLPRLELQQPRGDRHGDGEGRPGTRDAGPHLLLHDLHAVPAQFDAGDREVLPDRHLAGE